MAVKRIVVHCLEIEDKPGSLQKLLAQAASANVDLLCFAAFSAGDGRGRVYVSAKDPEALKASTQKLGIEATPPKRHCQHEPTMRKLIGVLKYALG